MTKFAYYCSGHGFGVSFFPFPGLPRRNATLLANGRALSYSTLHAYLPSLAHYWQQDIL